MDLVTRIYCGVAAFEREHALGCKKKKCEMPVGTNKGNAERDMLAVLHTCTASFDGRHIELLLCTMSIKRLKFSLHGHCEIEK